MADRSLPAQDEPFVVHYTNPHAYLLSRAWQLAVALACVIAVVMLLAPYAAQTGRGMTAERWSSGWAILLGAASLALAIDFAMLARRVLSGMPALLIDGEGLVGYWAGWPCEIAADGIDQVEVTNGVLSIYSKHAGMFGKWLPTRVAPNAAGGRYDYRARITIPLGHVDRGEREIRQALAGLASTMPSPNYTRIGIST
jgi:hypothetical protein